jgi:hypothetical protein
MQMWGPVRRCGTNIRPAQRGNSYWAVAVARAEQPSSLALPARGHPFVAVAGSAASVRGDAGSAAVCPVARGGAGLEGGGLPAGVT